MLDFIIDILTTAFGWIFNGLLIIGMIGVFVNLLKVFWKGY